MAKLTIVFGILISLVGVIGYAATHHPHSLIPIALGLVLALLGAAANTPEIKRRMLMMHIAVTVGLLGFLGTVPGIVALIKQATGVATSVRLAAAEVQAATAVLCLVFVLLCVRSFIVARRARTL